MKYKFNKQSIQESLKSRQWLFARIIIVGIILAGLLDHLKVIGKEPPSEIKAIDLHLPNGL